MKVDMKFYTFLVLQFCLLFGSPIKAEDEVAATGTAASPQNVAHDENADVKVTEGEVTPTAEGHHESKLETPLDEEHHEGPEVHHESKLETPLNEEHHEGTEVHHESKLETPLNEEHHEGTEVHHESKLETPLNEEHHEGNEAPHDMKTDERKEKPMENDGEVKIKAEEQESTEKHAKDKPVESEAEVKNEGHKKEDIQTVAADSASADMHEHLGQEKEKSDTNQTEEKPYEIQPHDEKQFMKTMSAMTFTIDDKMGETAEATTPADKKAAEEKEAAQVNEAPQEVNFVFPTNNPNKEDEFEKMAKKMTTNKDLDEELAKKLASDWMEHGDHNNETDQPNFVFNTSENKTGDDSVSFKIQPENELTPIENKKNDKISDNETNENKDVRSILPETNTGAEKASEPRKDDTDAKNYKIQTTNDTKPKKSMLIDESQESAEEKPTSREFHKQGNGVIDSKEATDTSKEESNGQDQIENENSIGKKKKPQTGKQLSVEKTKQGNGVIDRKEATDTSKEESNGQDQIEDETENSIGKKKKPQSGKQLSVEKTEQGNGVTGSQEATDTSKKESNGHDQIIQNESEISTGKNKKPQNDKQLSVEKQPTAPAKIQDDILHQVSRDYVKENTQPINKEETKKPKTGENNKIKFKKNNPKAPEVKAEDESSNEVQSNSKETVKAHTHSNPQELGKGPALVPKPKELTNNKKEKPITKQTKTNDKSDANALPGALISEHEIMKGPLKFDKQPGPRETPRKLELKPPETTDREGKPIGKLDKSGKPQPQLTEEELMKNAMKFEKPSQAVSTIDPLAPKLAPVLPKNEAQGNQTKAEDDGTSANTTLVFVEVIFRHGDRYKGLEPDETYPLDPYAVEDPFWLPYGCEQLRNKGKLRGYWLGKFLRKRYNGFLKEEYYHHDIRITSADLDRCIDSAHVMTVGLYPPTGINIWNDNVGRFYQPIPVRTLDPEDDIFLNEEITCIPYERELDNILFEGMRNFNAKYRYVYEYLEMYTGMPVTTLNDVAQIYTTLRIENENGRKLPDWVNLVFPDKLRMLNAYYNQIRTSTDYFKTIQAGPLLTLLMDELRLKVANRLKPNYKIKFWSGFDTTILKLMYTLKETQPSLEVAEELLETDYNGALMIEMHLINKTHYVKVLYVNMDSLFAKTKAPRPVKICGGIYLCPLDQFLQRMDKYKVYKKDWFKMCNLTYCPNDLLEKHNLQYLRR